MKEWKTLRGRCVLSVCGWGKLRVFWLWIPFWLLNTSTTLFGLPKRCTVAELLHIASDSDNDSVHIGIILLCEVLASSLLNMHECLKWILEDPTPHHPYPPPAPSPSLSNYIIIFLSIKIQMHNLNIWQQQAEREAFCSAAGSKVAFDERRMLNWHCCGKKKKKKQKKTIKEKQSSKIFPHVKFDGTTSKVWHRNILTDVKYSARLQRGCTRWKHSLASASTCQSVVVSLSYI